MISSKQVYSCETCFWFSNLSFKANESEHCQFENDANCKIINNDIKIQVELEVNLNFRSGTYSLILMISMQQWALKFAPTLPRVSVNALHTFTVEFHVFLSVFLTFYNFFLIMICLLFCFHATFISRQKRWPTLRHSARAEEMHRSAPSGLRVFAIKVLLN